MKRFSLLPLYMVVIAGGLFLGCENQIEAPEAMTLQTRSAVEVLPADARFVGMVNLEAMQHNTAINPFDALDAGNEFGARLQDFIEATGFDPEEDLREVYIAVDDMGPHAEPSLVAYAKFDRKRLYDYVEQNLKDTFERTDYKGVTIYYAQEDDHTVAFALASDNMMVGSASMDAVEAMLDRLTGTGRALKDNAASMALITSASGGSSAWFIMRDIANEISADSRHTEDQDPLSQNAEQIGMALQDIAVSLTILEDGADGTIYMQTKEGVSSADVADLTKGVVAAMKGSNKTKDAERQMLDRIRIRTKGDQVQVDFFVDNNVLAEMR